MVTKCQYVMLRLQIGAFFANTPSFVLGGITTFLFGSIALSGIKVSACRMIACYEIASNSHIMLYLLPLPSLVLPPPLNMSCTRFP